MTFGIGNLLFCCHLCDWMHLDRIVWMLLTLYWIRMEEMHRNGRSLQILLGLTRIKFNSSKFLWNLQFILLQNSKLLVAYLILCLACAKPYLQNLCFCLLIPLCLVSYDKHSDSDVCRLVHRVKIDLSPHCVQ